MTADQVLTTDEVADLFKFTGTTRRTKVARLVAEGALRPLIERPRPMDWRFARAEVLELIGAAPADPDTAPPSRGAPTTRNLKAV